MVAGVVLAAEVVLEEGPARAQERVAELGLQGNG